MLTLPCQLHDDPTRVPMWDFGGYCVLNRDANDSAVSVVRQRSSGV